MLQHPPAVRAAFEEGAATFLRTMRGIDPSTWDDPEALGEWTVRELAAHTLRAFLTVEQYLAAEPTIDRILGDAAEYYGAALADPGVHVSVAERARQAARQLTDPVGEAEVVVERVLALVAATADDEPVNSFAGQITLSEYLTTRVVELGVHTLDLQRATGQPAELHPDTSSVVLSVLTQLANPVPMILALTARAPLPEGYSVFG